MPITIRVKDMHETLVKYLSGLVDSDGSISFNFSEDPRHPKMYRAYLALAISASEAVDVHGFIESLPGQTGFGSIDRAQGHNKSTFYVVRWTVRVRAELEMLLPRLIKHAFVKGKHLQRMFDKWKENRGKLLSSEECDVLKEFAKASRADAGPVKPKNFPSWGWLGGYMDGNGSFRAGLRKDRGRLSYQASMHASCHQNDAMVLEFIQKAHGGYIKPHSAAKNCMVWERNLGKRERSFALAFLPKLVNHARLKKHKIEQLIAFHHGHLQRPSEQTSTEEATV